MIIIKDVSLVSQCGTEEIITLKDVNLTIYDGDFVSITDTGTQDKYCLFNLIGALDAPSTGTVLFEKSNISELSERDLEKLRLKNIGFVFKCTFLMPNLTVAENIGVVLKEAGHKKKEIEKRTAQVLEDVGMAAKADLMPADLSPYEAKAVGIARAMANRPKLLLVNEPPLEPNSDGRTTVDLLAHLNEKGWTIVITTDHEEVARKAKTHYLIDDGKVRKAH